MARKKLLHIKSRVANGSAEVGFTPKLPSPAQIDYGEIAVNYANGLETLAIKNDVNQIVSFSNDAVLMGYVDSRVSGINEVAIVYSGQTTPSDDSRIEVFVDENVVPEDVDVYTQRQVDDKISAATDDAKAIIKVSGASDDYKSEIVVDENVDPQDVDVYTQAQVDGKIDAAKGILKYEDSSSSYNTELLVDENTDLSVDFYTKAQVDTALAALEARIDAKIAKLKADNNLV